MFAISDPLNQDCILTRVSRIPRLKTLLGKKWHSRASYFVISSMKTTSPFRAPSTLVLWGAFYKSKQLSMKSKRDKKKLVLPCAYRPSWTTHWASLLSRWTDWFQFHPLFQKFTGNFKKFHFWPISSKFVKIQTSKFIEQKVAFCLYEYIVRIQM